MIYKPDLSTFYYRREMQQRLYHTKGYDADELKQRMLSGVAWSKA